jgi:hypothetical protein
MCQLGVIYCELPNFVEYVNNDLTLKNDFDKDFVMRSCLVLTGLPHVYKVANFTKENLDIIKNNWSKIKKTLEQTILLVNSFGLGRDLLTSANALHPIAYYLHKTGNLLLGTTTFDVINSREIHRWLLITLLNNIFGGNSDSTIGLSREIVKDELSKSFDFPTDLLLIGLKTHGKYSSLNDDFIDEIMLITYSRKTAFLALSLIQDGAGTGNNLFHIDHISPKSWFTTANLQSVGISVTQINVYQEYASSITNLQILLASENQEKSNQSLEEWIKFRNDEFKRKHCIPTNNELYKIENFLLFVNERKKLIEEKLKEVFNIKKLGYYFTSLEDNLEKTNQIDNPKCLKLNCS